MFGEPRVESVGKSKYDSDTLHDGMPMSRSALPPAATRTTKRNSKGATNAQQLYFQLREFEEFRQPSFNVLYVQTPKPMLSRFPLTEALGTVFQETAELLAPLLRLGVPENSLIDKLPYYREDGSSLPNTVRPRVQKVLRANIQFAEAQAAASAKAAEEWMRLKKERKDLRRSGSKRLPVPQQLAQLETMFGNGGHDEHGHIHIPQPRFYTHEMPTWMVPALNLAAYFVLCGLGGLDWSMLLRGQI